MSSQPTAQTVSVLFTDLVDSTATADRLGPTAAWALRGEHFGMLREVLERTAGREVKNLGDGLMAAFDSAAQALACAVQMQQALDARNRRAVEKLGLRIGVSIGETMAENGDHFGEPVVECARLCAHADAGQIVVSDLVRQVGGSRDAHTFEALGDLNLKGISTPVRAFDLVWEPAPAAGMALPARLREIPAAAYVGRHTERERLASVWDSAQGGSVQLALIEGEAGVGKTRLSTHLAMHVHGQFATVLYGRCDEDLGLPYQPWIQALGHLVAEAPQSLLESHARRFGGDVARLVPLLRERVAELPAPRESDPETERYLLYAVVAGLLGEASVREPVLLIVDDLHWADAPTLSMLRHLVTVEPEMAVMIVGTYRDSDLPREHPLAALLAALHGEQGVERIRLAGLSEEDLLALMEGAAGHELDESGRELAAEITRETAGNPFFAGEVLRHLTESRAIVRGEDGRWQLVGGLSGLGLPQSVREVIGQRVERLGPDARKVLSAASVIGRDFDLDLLLETMHVPQEGVLDLLDRCVAASLLRENRDRVGRFTFAHALVEHTLYEDLGPTRRALLHRQVAEALERQCGDHPGARLGELAGHWAAAVGQADGAKALHYAVRAGEQALAQLAPDEAARWFRSALELQARAAPDDDAVRCDLLLSLGEAQRQTGKHEHRETLLEAAALARELADTDRLCVAVTGYSRGYSSEIGAVDVERVRALEATAELLSAKDPRLARVLSLLASELHYAGQPARCRELASRALDLARAAGDPAALAYTIHYAILATAAPDTLAERRALADELMAISDDLADPGLGMLRAQRPWDVGLEAGERWRLESALRAMRTLTATVPYPYYTWQQMIYESVAVMLSGDLEDAERWALQAFEAGSAIGQPDALTIFGAQLFRIRYPQGRTGELVEQTEPLAHNPESLGAWRGFAAISLIESNRADEARALALAEEFQGTPLNFLWSMLFLWADACYRLDLKERAGELYELLVPYPGQYAGAGLAFGSIDWALGALASTLGRHDQALKHFEGASALDERFEAPLLLARTRATWARALIARGEPNDGPRAQELLALAEKSAHSMGAEQVTREVASCRSALAETQ